MPISGPRLPIAVDASLHIGRLEGRLDALETRVGRHETFVGSKLQNIETKLDLSLASQTQSALMLRATKWIIGIMAGASGWLVFWKVG